MKHNLNKMILLLILWPLFAQSQGRYPTNWDYFSQLEARQEVIKAALAGQAWMEDDDHRRRIYLGVVKVHTGIDARNGLQYLWDAVEDTVHRWGSFNVYSFMDAVLRLNDKLPPELIERGKERLAAGFGEDKGFTENHKLQYRTARYLFGQTWPEGPDFADGMRPATAMKEAEAWIFDWIDRTVSIGQLEFDSPNYHSLYFLCMTSLYDFALDPVMKRRAWMMMQVLIADWAVEYLKGNWVGAHSREKYDQVTHTILNSGTALPFGYLFFGDAQYHPELPEPFYVGLAAIQDFRPLSLLGNIATDRSTAYIHRETKAPRRGFGINQNDLPTWKYTYVTEDYALGSSYGDITAVENHRWDLTWVSERDGSTCFFIHPSFSRDQLLKFFGDPPDKILENILRQRPYYSDPDKWVEGSPFEEVFQHENTLVALYDIPEDEAHGHVNGFFSKNIEKRIEDTNGWIFCATNSIYFGVKPFTEGVWHEEGDHFRLTLNSRRTGVLMEVARKNEYPSFEAFRNRLVLNPLRVDLGRLEVAYTNSHGHRMEFIHGDGRILDGDRIAFSNWPLFDGPFLKSELGSKIIEISYKREKIILDFNTYEVRFQ